MTLITKRPANWKRGDPERVVVPNATNLKLVNTKKKKQTKKNVPTKSFTQAFNKLLPSKEIKYEHLYLTKHTNGVLSALIMATPLDVIVAGPQMNQRLGANIRTSWLHVNGTYQNNDTAKTRFLRMMVIREINAGGLNTTTFANYYMNSTGYTEAAPVGSQRDGRYYINRERFRIYYDHTYKIPIESQGALTINKKIRVPSITQYPLADPTSTLPTKGRLYFITNLFEGDNSPVATTVVESLSLRMFFKDYRKII